WARGDASPSNAARGPRLELSAARTGRTSSLAHPRIKASSDGKTQTLTNTGAGISVAVIDTGIQLNHPDLTPVLSGKNCVNQNVPPDDDAGHGTHVAGTIAARDNSFGVVGVAPGASLYAAKVLDSTGHGTWSQAICGIDWV